MRIKHTEDCFERLELAKKAIAKQVARFKALQEQCEALARKPVDSGMVEEYFKAVFTGDSTRIVNVRKRLVELMDHETNTLPGMKGTLWQPYNAVTFYVQHERPTRGATDEERLNNKFESNLWGSGFELIESAMEEALALV